MEATVSDGIKYSDPWTRDKHRQTYFLAGLLYLIIFAYICCHHHAAKHWQRKWSEGQEGGLQDVWPLLRLTSIDFQSRNIWNIDRALPVKENLRCKGLASGWLDASAVLKVLPAVLSTLYLNMIEYVYYVWMCMIHTNLIFDHLSPPCGFLHLSFAGSAHAWPTTQGDVAVW